MTAYKVSGFAEYIETETAGTLKANGGDIGGGTETIIIQRHFSDVRIYETEVTPTLKQNMGGGV